MEGVSITDETPINNTDENSIKEIAGFLFGRRDIYSSAEEITRDNVVDEVNSALTFHLQNVMEEEYLYWYSRGLQPILNRTKERNEFILNKVVENNAQRIIDFKNGYFLQESAFYVSRKPGKKSKVDKLNEYLYRSGKQTADNVIADWFHRVGKADLFVESNPDKEIPFKAYALNPRSAFVVYSLKPGNRPLFGVNMVINDQILSIDVYTEQRIFKLGGRAVAKTATIYPTYDCTASSIEGEWRNALGHIPIIEYRYNSVNMGAFESVVYLLDAINNVQSNRVDGIDQFIQSIAIAVNCEFPEDTTASKIKQAGLIALRSIGENKADFKILSEELDQQQTQTLADNLYDRAMEICAVPTSARQGSATYDSTGQAAIFNNGWEQAASCARNTEDLFRQSNRYFDEIILSILSTKGLIKDLSVVDFELNFVRNETANVQSKAQAFQTMMAAGLHPELALKKSGLSNDPVADLKMSEKYMKMIWGNPDKVDEAEQTNGGDGEAEIVESDNDNGEDTMGGAV